MPEDAETLEDAALARRIAAAGAAIDSAAETELYRRLAPRVRLYGLRHLRDRHAAHDLMQQVLLMTLERLRAGKLREPERIASFVLGMCRMVVLEIRRGTWRRETLLETYGNTAEAVEVPEPLALDADKLAACLQALAERERAVVVLTFFADKVGRRGGERAGAFVRQRARHPPPRARAAARVHGRGGVMTGARCAKPIDFEALVAYWLGELPAAAEAPIEEHLFGCAYCTRRLEELAALAFGIRAAVRDGAVRAVITQPFLEHMKRQGMRIREYRLAPGERVACTIRADDDAVVGRMQVPLAGVKRVDALQSLDLGDGRVQQWRVEDVPFDPNADEVLALPSAAALKKLPAHTFRVQLVAVDEAGERPLGEYTFAHTPS